MKLCQFYWYTIFFPMCKYILYIPRTMYTREKIALRDKSKTIFFESLKFKLNKLELNVIITYLNTRFFR